MRTGLSVLSVMLFLSACTAISNFNGVTELSANRYKVQITGATQAITTNEALSRARSTCPKYELLDKKVRYRGSLTRLKYNAEDMEAGDSYTTTLVIKCSR